MIGRKTFFEDVRNNEKMAKEMDVPFLGKIPMEIEIAQSGDSGKPFIEAFKDSETAKKISEIINKL